MWCISRCDVVLLVVGALASGSKQSLNVCDQLLIVVLVIDGCRLHTHRLQPVLILDTHTQHYHQAVLHHPVQKKFNSIRFMTTNSKIFERNFTKEIGSLTNVTSHSPV